jgi:hypothetical protein
VIMQKHAELLYIPGNVHLYQYSIGWDIVFNRGKCCYEQSGDEIPGCENCLNSSDQAVDNIQPNEK